MRVCRTAFAFHRPNQNQESAGYPVMGSSGDVEYVSKPGDDEDGGVEVVITTDTSAAPHKAGEGKLYVMRNSGDPDGPKLYFTEAEWDAFVLGVKDGEFDLDENGNLPPLPGQS